MTWYLVRAAGWTSYALLTLSIVLGLGLSGRWRSVRWPRFALNDVHKFLSLLTLVFIAIHVGALILDSYIQFSIPELLLPGLSGYRPVWTALGIVAMWLALAIWASELLRKRIGQRWWRRLHYATFAVWVASTLHGLGAGTDGTTLAARLIYLAATATVVGLTIWRAGVAGRTPKQATRPAAGPGADVRTARLDGLLERTLADGLETVRLDATLTGGLDGSVRLLAAGRPGASAPDHNTLAVELTVLGWRGEGRVTHMTGTRIGGIVTTGPGGPPVRVEFDLAHLPGGRVGGTATLTAPVPAAA
jgi:sulfoxide reductase heme-binding subunit YedZ